MESDNGIATTTEDESGPLSQSHVDQSAAEVKVAQEKDNEDSSSVKGGSENVVKDEFLCSAELDAEASMPIQENKISSPAKEPRDQNGINSKSSKRAKDQQKPKVLNISARNMKSSFSKSLSLPARGDNQKSIDGKLIKSDIRKPRSGASNALNSSISDNAASHVKPLSNRVATGIKSKVTNSNGTHASATRATIAVVPRLQQAVSNKSGSGIAETRNLPSAVTPSTDQHLRKSLQVKDDMDAHSQTSSTTPRGSRRNSVSGFAFRLDERAEKRKEFFSKLEEKIHAKEMEKTNLQEKSKETQDAEIKQLRKSLTFKAAPMPNFYKEPPPKVELKKIPTTRPLSPKLGRHKAVTTLSKNSLESEARLKQGQSQIAKGIQSNSDKETTASKRPIRKSLSKLNSKETMNAKIERQPEMTKTKESNGDSKAIDVLEGEVKIIFEDSDKNSVAVAKSTLVSVSPEIMTSELIVGV